MCLLVIESHVVVSLIMFTAISITTCSTVFPTELGTEEQELLHVHQPLIGLVHGLGGKMCVVNIHVALSVYLPDLGHPLPDKEGFLQLSLGVILGPPAHQVKHLADYHDIRLFSVKTLPKEPHPPSPPWIQIHPRPGRTAGRPT